MILVTAVKNHEEHKKSLLKLIDEFIVETIDDHHNTQYETLSTDFHLPINVERPWNDYFYKEIVNDFLGMSDFGMTDVRISSIVFS